MENFTFRKLGTCLYAFNNHELIEIDTALIPAGVISVSHSSLLLTDTRPPATALKCSEQEFLRAYALAMVRLQSAISFK